MRNTTSKFCYSNISSITRLVLFFLCIVFLPCKVFGSCDCNGGLLQNHSFETGISSWTWSAEDDFFISIDFPECGNFNAFLDWDEGLDAVVWQQVDEVEEDNVYLLSFYGGTHDPSYDHSVRVVFYDIDGNALQSYITDVNHDSDLGYLFSYTLDNIIAPANSSYLKVEGHANGNSLELDKICLQDVTPEACNGSVTGVYLYDQATDDKIPFIPELQEGAIVYADLLPSNYYIAVEVDGNIESSNIKVNGTTQSCDNQPPYTWPINAQNESNWNGGVGSYDLEIEVYNFNGCGSEICEYLSFTIELVEDVCANHVIGETNSRIAMGLIVSPDIIGSESDIVNFTFVLVNNSGESMSDINLVVNESLFSGEEYESSLSPVFAGDPNNNGFLDDGEIWFYNAIKTYSYGFADVYIVAAAIEGQGECGPEVAAAAELIFTSGVNMDIVVKNEDIIKNGDIVQLELITRLLIDEKAAINPGKASVVINNRTVEIPLAKTRWELRDLRISCSELNDGNEFDPFDLPATVDLDILIDQNGVDGGRNTNKILDEEDAKNTTKMTCRNVGFENEDCTFPDWAFGFSFIPTAVDEHCYEVVAADYCSLWRSEENPPGSGIFEPFVEVDDYISTVGRESECFEIKKQESVNVNISPNPTQDRIKLSSSYRHVVQIIILDFNGKLVMNDQTTLNEVISLEHLESGLYFIEVRDEYSSILTKEILIKT